MKFNKGFLKISEEGELQISKSSSFHSLINNRKKINFEEIMSNFKRCYVIWVSGGVHSTTTTTTTTTIWY